MEERFSDAGSASTHGTGNDPGKLHRLQRVAVAVDIHDDMDSALQFAWHVAQKAGATLEVVYAMDDIFSGYTPFTSALIPAFKDSIQIELDAFIRKSMAALAIGFDSNVLDGPHTKPLLVSKVIYGFPDIALEAYSKELDLLIVGTSGRGAIGKKLFGSISSEVSKHAHCPVLLVPPDAAFRGLQNVLYASNFDSLGTLRIQQAVSFTRHFDSQLHFVHVSQSNEKEASLERILFESHYRDAHPTQPFLFTKMLSDDITGALYEYAFYHQIELLVFVTHQRSFWDNILHRSITGKAALTSELPILVIHGDGDVS